MIIGPATWREFFKPRLAAIIDGARGVAPALRVLYHSDGDYTPIVGELVEIGVDAINPLQPEYMDPVKIRQRHGARPALWGTVGRQTTFSWSTPEEIDRAIEEIKRQNRITHEQLIEALRASGITYEQYREDLRHQILRLKLLNIQVRSRINVSDSEVRRYYDQNLRRSGADVRVRLRQIFVSIPESAPRSIVRERRKHAQSLADRVRAGEDFSHVARQESDDLLTRAEGGEVGWVGRGTLPPELEEIVFTMQPSEIRGPVYTDRGAYLVELLERKASAARPFDQIKEELRAQIGQEQVERATRAWLTEVRKRAYVDIRF